MKKRKRIKIKWGNVGLLFALIVFTGILISDFITLVTSRASLTYYGVITGILTLIVIDFIVEYFINEMEGDKNGCNH